LHLLMMMEMAGLVAEPSSPITTTGTAMVMPGPTMDGALPLRNRRRNPPAERPVRAVALEVDLEVERLANLALEAEDVAAARLARVVTAAPRNLAPPMSPKLLMSLLHGLTMDGPMMAGALPPLSPRRSLLVERLASLVDLAVDLEAERLASPVDPEVDPEVALEVEADQERLESLV
jgi:hypothetical protein